MTKTLATTASEVMYVEGFKPGYLGRIAQLHGEYYAKLWGSGPAFEALMARELGDFYHAYSLDRDLLLTAHKDGCLIGSIAINGAPRGHPGVQLRWFLLAEEARGYGIGRTLLERVLSFCREKGYKTVFLWTVEGLPQSRHLYESVGFRVVESVRDDRTTLEQTNLRLEMSLEPSEPR